MKTKVCKNCVNRKAKKCVVSDNYTARKATCENFKEKARR